MARSGTSIWAEFRSGLDYVLGVGPIRRLILLVGCSLLTGTLAHQFGTTVATCANGSACLILGWLFCRQLPSFREQARPILEQAGVLPGADQSPPSVGPEVLGAVAVRRGGLT